MTRVFAGSEPLQLASCRRHVFGLAPQRDGELLDIASRPLRLACEHVDAGRELLAGLGRQDRVGHDGIIGHALADDLDDDEAARGVAGTGLEVVQEGQRPRVLSRRDHDRLGIDGEQAVVEAVVLGVRVAVDEGCRRIRAHVRDGQRPLERVDVVGQRAHADRVGPARLHLDVVGVGHRARVGLGVQNADADSALARLAELVHDAIPERDRPLVARDARVDDGCPVRRDRRGPALGLGDDPIERHDVAVGVHPEPVEVDRDRPAAQDASFQRLGQGRTVGIARQNLDPHRRGVCEKGRTRREDRVLDRVLPRLVRREIAHEVARAERERAAGRRDGRRIERRAPA